MCTYTPNVAAAIDPVNRPATNLERGGQAEFSRGNEEQIERGEAFGDLIDRHVEHRRDRAGVVATHGDHPTVEVLALHLDESQVSSQHLEGRTLELQELGNVDRQFLVDRRLQGGGGLAARDLTRQQLLDRNGIELREPVEARHRRARSPRSYAPRTDALNSWFERASTSCNDIRFCLRMTRKRSPTCWL